MESSADYTNITAYRVDDTATADTVLIRAIGEMKNLVIIGQDNDGKWDFRANEDLSVDEILMYLNKGKRIIKDYM